MAHVYVKTRKGTRKLYLSTSELSKLKRKGNVKIIDVVWDLTFN